MRDQLLGPWRGAQLVRELSWNSSPWSGHLDSTDECVNKWNNNLMFLSLFLILVNKKLKKD